MVSTSRNLYARFPHIDAADADGWCGRTEAKGGGHAVEAETFARGGHITALATRGAAEYDFISLLQQRLRAMFWPHWRLRCMLACSH